MSQYVCVCIECCFLQFLDNSPLHYAVYVIKFTMCSQLQCVTLHSVHVTLRLRYSVCVPLNSVWIILHVIHCVNIILSFLSA